MAKLKLKLTGTDLNAVQACLDGTRRSSEFVKVPRQLLNDLLRDHEAACAHLKPQHVEP